MGNKITEIEQLVCRAEDGQLLTAQFMPSRGMNLVSFKKGECEAIDQSTKPLFEKRFAGLGAMIGPHFHHRNEAVIPPVKNEHLFPHIAEVRAHGSKEPFSHGIGRYAPWTLETITENSIKAVLSGEHLWNDVKLKELEGQDFRMYYEAKLRPTGLEIELSVNSETESVVGLHTYYALGGGSARIRTRVQERYIDKSEEKKIPKEWGYGDDHNLLYRLDKETDFGFHPYPDSLHGTVNLECESHGIQVQYFSEHAENSFQVWHPKEASFVCIEPLSSFDPRKPKLTVSALKILISFL